MDRLPTRYWLLVGDLGAVVTFAFVGSLHHGNDPVANPLYFANTAAPFVFGWLLAAFVVGVYALETSAVKELAAVAATWVVADAVGLGLRSTAYFHGGVQTSFVVVSLVFGGGFVLAWRVAVTASEYVVRRRASET